MTAPTVEQAEDAVGDLEEQITRRRLRRRVRNQKVRVACVVPMLVAEFVGRLVDLHGEVDEALRSAVYADGAYGEAFVQIGSITREFASLLTAFDRVRGAGDELAVQLTDLAEALLAEFTVALEAFDAAVKAKAGTTSHYANRKERALDMAKDIRRKLPPGRDVLGLGLGVLVRPDGPDTAGQACAHRHYATIEKDQLNTAGALRRAVVGLLSAATVGLVVLGACTDTAVMREVAFLAAAVPVLMMAAVLARESSWHRSTAQWAREQQASAGPDALDVLEPRTDDPDDRRDDRMGDTGS